MGIIVAALIAMSISFSIHADARHSSAPTQGITLITSAPRATANLQTQFFFTRAFSINSSDCPRTRAS